MKKNMIRYKPNLDEKKTIHPVIVNRKEKGKHSMGLWNQLFGKKEVKQENQQKPVNESAEEIKKEAPKELKDIYTFMVEQIFTVKDRGCIAAGIIRNGEISLNDTVYVLGRGRNVQESKVLGLENPQAGQLEKAAHGTPVGILLENITNENIHPGDIISNVKPNTEDVNEPVVNPRIQGLMRQAAGKPTEEMMNLIYEELAMNAKFLSAIMVTHEPVKKEDGTATFEQGTKMQLPLLTAPDGSKYYPAFTDWQELNKWHEILEPKTLMLSLDDYVALVQKNEDTKGIVINPFGENMMVDRPLLEHLKMKKDMLVQGKTVQHIDKNEKISLAEAAEFPVEMVKKITEELKKENCVEKAWLRLMKRKEEISYLFVADIELPGNQEAVFERVANAARPFLKGIGINMITYQQEFGKNAVEGVEPFYQR